MHVVYLYTHFPYPGGAGLFILETAKRLAQKGIKITIIAQKGSPDLLKKYKKINFIFVGGPVPNRMSYWINYLPIYKKVENVLDNLNPNIIFPHIFPD